MRQVRVSLALIFVILLSMGGIAGASPEIAAGTIPEIIAGEELKAANGRITEVKCFLKTSSIGYPVIEGDIIAWSETNTSDGKTYPCYFKIGDNAPHYINTSIAKDEKLQLSNGLLVYRTDKKHLAATNLSDKSQYNIEPGMSRELITEEVSADYKVNGDYIVFVKGATSSSKRVFIISHNITTPRELFSAGATDIRIGKYVASNIILWRENEKLYYFNLDDLDKNDEDNKYEGVLLSNAAYKAAYIGIYKNEAVYFDSSGQINRQQLTAGSVPQAIAIGAQVRAICIVEDLLYYVRDNHIWCYDLFQEKDLGLIMILDQYPLNISSNGKDIVYKKGTAKNIYWYVGIDKVKVTKVDNCNKVEVGEEIKLQAEATLRNRGTEDITSQGVWESSDEDVLIVEKGVCQTIGAGKATITVSYEGESDSIDIEVIEEIGIRIEAQELVLEIGGEERFTVYLLYSDGSMKELTEGLVWNSILNEISAGVYKANRAGTDIIRVTYGDWEASLEIIVKGEVRPEPEEPEPDSGEEKPDPEIEPEPKPQPNPSPGYGSDSDYSNNIVYNTETEVKLDKDDIDIPVWKLTSIPINRLDGEMTWSEKGRILGISMLPYELWPLIDLAWDMSWGRGF